MSDIVIIGAGPAGLSAAINAKIRGKDVTLISNDQKDSGLFKAERIDNYLGLPRISGKKLIDEMTTHALEMGIEISAGRIQNILPMGSEFGVGFGSDFLMTKCIILATGIVQSSLFPGEKELLGSGVSYCATCDGMLYRGKKVCVVCLAPDAEHEADYLSSIGCDVTKVYSKKIVINGKQRVESIEVDGEEIPCEGVFILRKTIAHDTLLPGIEIDNGHIKVNRNMETNIPGVFAAGDCIGKPYQIAKAVGEGLIAGLNASDYLDQLK